LEKHCTDNVVRCLQTSFLRIFSYPTILHRPKGTRCISHEYRPREAINTTCRHSLDSFNYVRS